MKKKVFSFRRTSADNPSRCQGLATSDANYLSFNVRHNILIRHLIFSSLTLVQGLFTKIRNLSSNSGRISELVAVSVVHLNSLRSKISTLSLLSPWIHMKLGSFQKQKDSWSWNVYQHSHDQAIVFRGEVDIPLFFACCFWTLKNETNCCLFFFIYREIRYKQGHGQCRKEKTTA